MSNKNLYDRLQRELTSAGIAMAAATKRAVAANKILDEFEAKASQCLDISEGTPSVSPTPATKKKTKTKKTTTKKNTMHRNELELRVMRYMSRLKTGASPLRIFKVAVHPHMRPGDVVTGSNPSTPLIQARTSALLSSLRERGLVKKTGRGRGKVTYYLTNKGKKHYSTING